MTISYSASLGLINITTGTESGLWGGYTNTNICSLIEQAVAGYGTQSMAAAADTTVNITNGALSTGRNMYIKCTGAMSQNNNLIVPAASKLYFIENATTGSFNITVKTSGGTGISVPPNSKMLLMCDGTNVIEAIANLTTAGSFATLTVSGAASFAGTITASGLTASTNLALDASKNLVSVTNTGSGNNVLATSPTLVTPILGTPTSGTLTNCTGLSLTTGVTGTLPVTNGGTGTGNFTLGNYLKGNGTSAIATQAGIPAGDITSGTIATARLASGTASSTTYLRGDQTWASFGGLGVGQTWQNVAGSRVLNTSYQNTTGRSIQVSIQADTGSLIQVSPDSVTWTTLSRGDYYGIAQPIIPDTYYYRASGTGAIQYWAELR